MYEELVKRLREASCGADNTLWWQAADDIEALTSVVGTAYNELANNEASKPRWIPVTERLPKEFVSVQAHMTDAGQFPSVREAYLAGGKWFFPALNEHHPVDKWAKFCEPPKEE